MHGDMKTFVYFSISLHTSILCKYHRTNVLLDRHLTAKLGDFGFSQEFPQVVAGRSFITAAVVAKSLGYSPPEMDTCRVSPKSDVYSYGVVRELIVSYRLLGNICIFPCIVIKAHIFYQFSQYLILLNICTLQHNG